LSIFFKSIFTVVDFSGDIQQYLEPFFGIIFAPKLQHLGEVLSMNPYENLPETKFWSTSVTKKVKAKDQLEILGDFAPFFYDKKIASVGSCFASEIGKRLYQQGLNFISYEVGNSVFDSFGLGNVYTSTQLLQWLEFTTGARKWSASMNQVNGNQYIDLTINSEYQCSDYEELLEVRAKLASNMLKVIQSSDLLIITLGLTESWVSKNGEAFAMCPGTIKGNFDPKEHLFKNLTFNDVSSDLLGIKKIIETINPKTQIILTVSPVPLTATASDEHVLVATSKSKSTLRAAAGEFADRYENFHYLPSYELITHVHRADWRFDKNLRTVSTDGVDYVMGHIFRKQKFTNSDDHYYEFERLSEKACDEAKLDQFNKNVDISHKPSNPEIFLIGDSHFSRLGNAMDTANVNFSGGMIMNGSGFSDHEFRLSTRNIFDVEESEEGQDFWLRTFYQLADVTGSATILTNIGLQTHRMITDICNRIGRGLLCFEDIQEQFETFYIDTLQILKSLKQYGRVCLIEDPNFYIFQTTAFPAMRHNFDVYTKYLEHFSEENEIEYYSVNRRVLVELLENEGSLGEAVDSDGFHGTQLFYDRQLSALRKEIAF